MPATEATTKRLSRDQIATAKGADLVEMALRHTALRGAPAKERCGPCPRCGGDDRFHVHPNGWFFCRQCHPKRGDAIEFLRWMTPGLSFAEAVRKLAGGVSLPSPAMPQHRAPQRRRPQQELLDNWTNSAEKLVAQAEASLWAKAGEHGRAYLERRGLHSGTWLAYRIGYLPQTPTKERAAAIVLPWYRGGRLASVRFRFLDPEPGGAKIKALTGSHFAGLLFGGQALEGNLRTLALVEGEINAMSIWQVAHATGLDVLSLGSESATLTPAMVAYAQRYHTVLTWFDKPEIAAAVAGALPGAYAIASPQGKDANDWLREGLLGGLLSTARRRACKGEFQRERLLWDLWDAANGVQGIDQGTAQVVERLAGELRKPVSLFEAEPRRWLAEKGIDDCRSGNR